MFIFYPRKASKWPHFRPKIENGGRFSHIYVNKWSVFSHSNTNSSYFVKRYNILSTWAQIYFTRSRIVFLWQIIVFCREVLITNLYELKLTNSLEKGQSSICSRITIALSAIFLPLPLSGYCLDWIATRGSLFVKTSPLATLKGMLCFSYFSGFNYNFLPL